MIFQRILHADFSPQNCHFVKHFMLCNWTLTVGIWVKYHCYVNKEARIFWKQLTWVIRLPDREFWSVNIQNICGHYDMLWYCHKYGQYWCLCEEEEICGLPVKAELNNMHRFKRFGKNKPPLWKSIYFGPKLKMDGRFWKKFLFIWNQLAWPQLASRAWLQLPAWAKDTTVFVFCVSGCLSVCHTRIVYPL